MVKKRIIVTNLHCL